MRTPYFSSPPSSQRHAPHNHPSSFRPDYPPPSNPMEYDATSPRHQYHRKKRHSSQQTTISSSYNAGTSPHHVMQSPSPPSHSFSGEESPVDGGDDEVRNISSSNGLIRITIGKPMGIVFEPILTKGKEQGVRICELSRTGAAYQSQKLKVGDELLSLNDDTVSRLGFDEIMDLIIRCPAEKVDLLFRRPRNGGSGKESHGPVGASQPSPVLTTTTTTTTSRRSSGGRVRQKRSSSHHRHQSPNNNKNNKQSSSSPSSVWDEASTISDATELAGNLTSKKLLQQRRSGHRGGSSGGGADAVAVVVPPSPQPLAARASPTVDSPPFQRTMMGGVTLFQNENYSGYKLNSISASVIMEEGPEDDNDNRNTTSTSKDATTSTAVAAPTLPVVELCQTPLEIENAFRRLSSQSPLPPPSSSTFHHPRQNNHYSIPSTSSDDNLCSTSDSEWTVDVVSKNAHHKIAAIWRYDNRPANATTLRVASLLQKEHSHEAYGRVVALTRRTLATLGVRWGMSRCVISPDGGRLLEFSTARLLAEHHNYRAEEVLSLTSACVGYTALDMVFVSYFDENDEGLIASRHYSARQSCGEIAGGTVVPPVEFKGTWDDIPAAPTLKLHGAIVHLICHEEGKVVGLSGVDELQELSSVLAMEIYPPFLTGNYVTRTVDDERTVAGWLRLVNADEAGFRRDYERVMELMPYLFIVDRC